MERLPILERPAVQDITLMKQRLDDIDREIGRLNVEKLRLSHHFQYELKKIAVVNVPAEQVEKQLSTLSEDFHGDNVTGFENSPMRKKK